MLRCSVRRVGERIRINAQLISQLQSLTLLGSKEGGEGNGGGGEDAFGGENGFHVVGRIGRLNGVLEAR